MPVGVSTTYDTVVGDIRANAGSPQTAKTYVGAMNAIRRVAGSLTIGQALTRDYRATFRDLLTCSKDLSAGTIKTRITGIVGSFKLCKSLADEDASGAAREFWKEHHDTHLSSVRAAAASNFATEAQTKNMVKLTKVLKTARSMSHHSLKQSLDKVLLTIAALVPAKRADWGRLRIVQSSSDATDDENALVVTPSSVTLILNRYKTFKAYGKHVEEIIGEAADEIRNSLAAHPRLYLFVSPERPNGMTNEAFSSYLSGTFDRNMRKHVTVDLLRHIWVTDSVDPRRMTVQQINEFARKMLHGADTQSLYFLVKPLKP